MNLTVWVGDFYPESLINTMKENSMSNPVRFLALRPFTSALVLSVLLVFSCTTQAAFSADTSHTSTVFSGPKVNGGTVTHSKVNGRNVLTLSADFKVPDTPAPHWQVIDSKGNVYLLNRLVIKDDKFNQSVTLPAYIKDVAKVQIWCAWAEALLGEASFPSPQR